MPQIYILSWSQLKVEIFVCVIELLNLLVIHWPDVREATSPIIPSAPKCFSRHFIFHRKCVCFEKSVSIQAISSFLGSETIFQSVKLFLLVIRYFFVLISNNFIYRPQM